MMPLPLHALLGSIPAQKLSNDVKTSKASYNWVALCEKVPYGLSRCHTKRRTGAAPRALPYFGMTTTQDIRDPFAKRSPIVMTEWICSIYSGPLYDTGPFGLIINTDYLGGCLSVCFL